MELWKKIFLFLLCLAGGVMMVSCASDSGSYYHDSKSHPGAIYGEITKRSFHYEGPARNPVIVIHGLLGASLVDSAKNENIWGNFALSEMISGGKFGRLAHPMMKGVPLRNVTNSVLPSGLLEKSAIHVMGLQFNLDNYDILVNTLKESGYIPDNEPLPPGKNFYSQFIFYYDWRRDISENAVELERYMTRQRRYLQAKYEELYGLKDYDIQFDLIAHSMGGLLARYFVRYGGTVLPDDEKEELPVTMKGAEYVDRVVIIGTPNAGYVDTLIELTEGLRLAPASPAYPKSIIGSFVSYYQMLPNLEGRHVIWSDNKKPVDYLSLNTWKKLKWGLADPNQDKWLKEILPHVETPEERYAIALDHLDKCLKRARQFKKAMQIHAEAYPSDVSVFLIAGDAVMTNHTLAVNRKSGELQVLNRDAGDGKITASSARLDLRDGGEWLFFSNSPINWRAVYYLPGSHMGIMNSDIFSSNLRFILMGLPTQQQRQTRNQYMNMMKKVKKYQNDSRRK